MQPQGYPERQDLIQDLIVQIDDLHKDNDTLTIRLKLAEAYIGKLKIENVRIQDGQLELVAKLLDSGKELGISPVPPASALLREPVRYEWRDLAALAQASATSQDPAYPIADALLEQSDTGWRAAAPGPQTIQLRFDVPQRIRAVQLEFFEPARPRTQEYTLAWSADSEHGLREAVRQQWNFNPDNAATETETHRLDLENVTLLELRINPDIASTQTYATLARLRLA